MNAISRSLYSDFSACRLARTSMPLRVPISFKRRTTSRPHQRTSRSPASGIFGWLDRRA